MPQFIYYLATEYVRNIFIESGKKTSLKQSFSIPFDHKRLKPLREYYLGLREGASFLDPFGSVLNLTYVIGWHSQKMTNALPFVPYDPPADITERFKFRIDSLTEDEQIDIVLRDLEQRQAWLEGERERQRMLERKVWVEKHGSPLLKAALKAEPDSPFYSTADMVYASERGAHEGWRLVDGLSADIGYSWTDGEYLGYRAVKYDLP